MQQTLVLDSGYQAVGTVSWQRAITLLWEGKVEVVEEYSNREVRSVTITLKMPSVIRFLKTIRGRRRLVKFSRENVLARDCSQCQYCGIYCSRQDATYDHVIPRAKGGQTTWDNVVICCVPCNQKKGGRTPEQAGMKLLTIPVKPKTLQSVRFNVMYIKSMPPEWKTWVRDVQYWNGELDNNNP